MRQHDIYIQNKRFSDLNPLMCGSHKCDNGYCFGPYIRDYYLIHYVQHGEGEIYKNDKVYQASAGQIFIIRPGELVTYKASETEPWEYIWIGFNGSLCKRLDDIDDVLYFKKGSILIDMLYCEQLENIREEFLAAQLFLLYSELFGKEREAGKYTDRAENYIALNYMKNITVEDIADDMSINRRYLSRIFKRDHGMTVKEYITKIRMSHALRFLEEGYSVKETAFMCGYNEVFNFSKMFKKYYSYSPNTVKRK